jgi:hypothetical protein
MPIDNKKVNTTYKIDPSEFVIVSEIAQSKMDRIRRDIQYDALVNSHRSRAFGQNDSTGRQILR